MEEPVDLVAVEHLLDEVGVLCAQRHALDMALCEKLAALREAGNPQVFGYRGAPHWLAVVGGMSLPEAHRYVRVSTELGAMAELVDDAHEGRIGVVALDQVAKVVTCDNVEPITRMARTLSVGGLTRALGAYRRYRETPECLAEELSSWSEHIDERGRYHLRASLHGSTGELLHAAVEQARVGTTNLDDAIGHLASCSLDRSGPGVHQVLVHVELDELAQLFAPEPSHVRLGGATYDRDGRRVDDLAEIVDDAKLAVVVAHEGKPLWLSNSVRTATTHQHRVLRARSHGRCEVPGCEATRYLRAHHVVFHSLGGPTDLENLMYVCGFHHRAIHRHRWRVVHLGQQNFEVFDHHNRSLGTTRDPNDARLPGDPTLPLPPPHMKRCTPRGIGATEPLTHYALDVFLAAIFDAERAA